MESEERIKYAKRALDGIVLGDCFGETFFMPDEAAALIANDFPQQWSDYMEHPEDSEFWRD